MKPFPLNNPKAASIRHLNTAVAVQHMENACKQTALRYHIITCSNVHNKSQLFELLATSLAFPDYFGHNWDALYDVLCDDHWMGEHGIVLHFQSIAAFQRQDAHDWSMLYETLEDAIDYWRSLNLPFWVFFDHVF